MKPQENITYKGGKKVNQINPKLTHILELEMKTIKTVNITIFLQKIT